MIDASLRCEVPVGGVIFDVFMLIPNIGSYFHLGLGRLFPVFSNTSLNIFLDLCPQYLYI